MGFVAGVVYATVTDFRRIGLPPKSLTQVDPADITQALQDASDTISGYFQSRFVLPLQTWSGDTVLRTVKIAAYLVMSTRGFDPEGKDKLIYDDYLASIEWCQEVSKGHITPVVTDSSPIDRPYAPNLISSCPQGWTQGSGGGNGLPFRGWLWNY